MKILAVGLVGALIGGIIVGIIAINFFRETNITQEQPNVNNDFMESISTSDDPPTTVEAVAELVTPTVVGVQTVEISQDMFMRERTSTGIGSGFIVTQDGYILTNHHVVTEDPKKITVSLKDGRSLEATKIWSDAILDLAVIKIDATGLPVAILGDSESLAVGQMAIAIGNPLGLTFERTVTAGIVSALNRSIISGNTIAEDLIQTDASINSGNSGGPLLNNRGNVIGINTYKIDSGEGMGFAIPINIAKPIVNQIINNGEFKPTMMGISCLDREIARYYSSDEDIDLKAGILIMEVQPESGAEKAGLVKDAIITHIDDIEVNTMLKLREIIYNKLPGESVQVRYTLNGKTETTKVTLMGADKQEVDTRP
ncbi:trypsin-like serine protease [Alkalibaculum sp. M08DMB]|uniref:Trypsin-like serine protease n=2 Tax=Alkalibaculum sporogenes TaxID=2655001 RepID=A0A6A7K7U3_9FIRM|nr:trypsin-like serine protease [Alkalibaculum sporogenes]